MSSFRMTDRKVDRPTCIEIKIERLADEDPDLSWLDQNDSEMGEGFEARSAERKAGYGSAWDMIGIQAVAVYLVPTGGASTIQSLVSGGLWSIESDSDQAYLTEIEDEQISEVKALLDALNINYEGVEVER